MKLQFSLSFENYYEYNRICSKLKIGKGLRSIFNTGVCMLVAGAVGAAAYFIKLSVEPLLLYVGVAAAVIGIYMVLYSRLLFKRKLKKQVQKKFEAEDYFKTERTVEIFDDCLLDYSENDEYRAGYSEDLREFIETQNLFVVMVYDRRGIIIPKSAADTPELRALLKRIAVENDARYRYIKE